MHERTLAAAARVAGDLVELTSPCPGRFRLALAPGDAVRPGSVLGELEVLGQLVAILAPAAAAGAVVAVCDRSLARPAVDHGAMLVTVDPRGLATAAAAVPAATGATGAATGAAAGVVFRAPTSGRFYGRSAPDKPPFVSAGSELAAGTTVCLLEVMKTFHRVSYGGAELPDRARVRAVLVADGADVNAGDPLLALDPVST